MQFLYGKRLQQDQTQYAVKWHGYGFKEMTYEPIVNISTCYQSIEKYEIFHSRDVFYSQVLERAPAELNRIRVDQLQLATTESLRALNPREVVQAEPEARKTLKRVLRKIGARDGVAHELSGSSPEKQEEPRRSAKRPAVVDLEALEDSVSPKREALKREQAPSEQALKTEVKKREALKGEEPSEHNKQLSLHGNFIEDQPLEILKHKVDRDKHNA